MVLLLVSGAAAAQTGPDPAYTDGLSYASDYLAAQADNATTDPGAYATQKATADNATIEVAHAAYMACWIADDAGVPDATGVCANYYAAPEDVQSLNEDEEDEAQEAVDNVTADLNATSAEILDAVNDTVADPTTAPTQVQRIADALAGFVQRTAATLVALIAGLAGGIVDGLLGAAGLAGLGVTTAGQGLADLGGLLGDGALAVGDGIGAGAVASWDGMTVVGDAVAAGTRVAGDALATGAEATLDGVVAAAEGVGEVISSAASSLADAVQNLFGGGREPSGVTDTADGAVDGVTDGLDADGLLRPVRDLVDA